jgi:hypothetical protein
LYGDAENVKPLRTAITTALLAAALAMASSCVNLHDGKVAVPMEVYGSQPLFGGVEDPEFSCPDSANVVPDYDYELDGSGYYRVCHHRTNPADVKFTGRTAATNVVCMFPAQYLDGQHIYAKPDVDGGTNAPWYKCQEIQTDASGTTSTGIRMTFPGISWNAAFIVEGYAAATEMQRCLAQNNYYACPHYSFGIFRR